MTTSENYAQTDCNANPMEPPQRFEIWTVSFPDGGAMLKGGEWTWN